MVNFTCPRRIEDGMDIDNSPLIHSGTNKDSWTEYGKCSYCNSISTEEFFKLIDEGVELTPTDKNYKIYIGDGSRVKFYFQHLAREDQQRFVDYLNQGKLRISAPGYFYVRPFFIAPTAQTRPNED